MFITTFCSWITSKVSIIMPVIAPGSDIRLTEALWYEIIRSGQVPSPKTYYSSSIIWTRTNFCDHGIINHNIQTNTIILSVCREFRKLRRYQDHLWQCPPNSCHFIAKHHPCRLQLVRISWSEKENSDEYYEQELWFLF